MLLLFAESLKVHKDCESFETAIGVTNVLGLVRGCSESSLTWENDEN